MRTDVAAGPADEVATILIEGLGDPPISDLIQLSGGASRETWAFVSEGRSLVLQRDRPGGGLRRAALVAEVAAIRAAAAAGVPVATVVAAGEGWFVSERVPGETIPRRILRDDTYAKVSASFVANVAAAAAAIHGVAVAFIPDLSDETLGDWRDQYDRCGGGRPILELAFRWLEAQPPAPRRTLVHGDFRLGNLVVGPEGIRAVLDWEMVHLGDPAEDLGFLCVRSWRFGVKPPVAGLGEREALLAAYVGAGGMALDLGDLHRAEVWGTVRWGVIAMQQVHAHVSSAQRSVELAAIGRRIHEIEFDVLALLEQAP